MAGAVYRFRSSMLIRSPRAAAAAPGSRMMLNASVMLRRRGRGSAAILCLHAEEGGGYAVYGMVKRETRPPADAWIRIHGTRQYHCDPDRAPQRRDERHVLNGTTPRVQASLPFSASNVHLGFRLFTL